jgi:hypothetical protein
LYRLNSRKKVRAELGDIRETDTIPLDGMSAGSHRQLSRHISRNKLQPFAFSMNHPAEITVHKDELAAEDI